MSTTMMTPGPWALLPAEPGEPVRFRSSIPGYGIDIDVSIDAGTPSDGAQVWLNLQAGPASIGRFMEPARAREIAQALIDAAAVAEAATALRESIAAQRGAKP